MVTTATMADHSTCKPHEQHMHWAEPSSQGQEHSVWNTGIKEGRPVPRNGGIRKVTSESQGPSRGHSGDNCKVAKEEQGIIGCATGLGIILHSSPYYSDVRAQLY